MVIKIEKISQIPTVMPRQFRDSDAAKIREKVAKLKANGPGIKVTFDEPKQHFSNTLDTVAKPLEPMKFSYRTLDTEKKVFGIWRTQ